MVFFPERCAYWIRTRTLIMSDLHWGKSEALQAAGIPMPSSTLAEELNIITSLLDRTGAENLLILGDLMHSAASLPQVSNDLIAGWRQKPGISGIAIQLLRGNHDRFLQLPEAWRIEDIKGDVEKSPFFFSHAPMKKHDGSLVNWAGHIHPVFELRSRRDYIRTPCFVVSKKSVMLPAFGLTTGGYAVKRKPGERILAIAGDAVVEIH